MHITLVCHQGVATTHRMPWTFGEESEKQCVKILGVTSMLNNSASPDNDLSESVRSDVLHPRSGQVEISTKVKSYISHHVCAMIQHTFNLS